MSHDELRQMLDDYADGALAAGETRRIEVHLAECAACRAELADLRALLDAARRLPRGIEPPHELWPAVDARLGRPSLGSRSLWSLRYPLAAAAALLIAVSAAATALFLGHSAAPAARGTIGDAAGAPALFVEWRAAEEEYLRASAELARALDAARPGMDPGTYELVLSNLRVIDAAIQESRAALALDPANRELVEMLAARYRTKIDVLRDAARLSARL
jgi:hypothetical protein